MYKSKLINWALVGYFSLASLPVAIAQSTAGYQNGSLSVPVTTPVQIFAAYPGRVRIKLINYHATVDVWCRWGSIANSPTSVNGVGSFKLTANGVNPLNDFDSGVNKSALNCVANTGGPAYVYAEQY